MSVPELSNRLAMFVHDSADASHTLPRAGAWMNWVKKGFGIVMLAVAEYYLFEMGKLSL